MKMRLRKPERSADKCRGTDVRRETVRHRKTDNKEILIKTGGTDLIEG